MYSYGIGSNGWWNFNFIRNLKSIRSNQISSNAESILNKFRTMLRAKYNLSTIPACYEFKDGNDKSYIVKLFQVQKFCWLQVLQQIEDKI